MIGQVQLRRPSLGAELIRGMLNSAYRRVVDYRHWHGLMVRGEVVTPQIHTTGTVTVTSDSKTVTGTGTVWDATMVDRQFRVGITSSVYTIKAVNSATGLELDLPWGGANHSGVGYMIVKAYYSFGTKAKRILAAVNKVQNWPLKTDWTQNMLNAIDPQRSRIGWTQVVAAYAMNENKEPLWELYPWPTVRQGIPFLAYEQPADMVEDSDAPVGFIRSDVIVDLALGEALVIRKDLPGYDPDAAARFERRGNIEMLRMARADNDLFNKDTELEMFSSFIGSPDYEQFSVPPPDGPGWVW